MTAPTRSEQESRQKEREKFVRAFNSTMVAIWKEQITLLGVIDTGALFRSVTAIGLSYDSKFTSVTLTQSLRHYGLFVDYGTGSNTRRGNPDDIGRPNPRRRKRWFSRKHFASVMNLREFYADNLGRDVAQVVSNSLSAEISAMFSPPVDHSVF